MSDLRLWDEIPLDERKVILKKQQEWLKNLKVGDMVCDCRYKHIKVKAFSEERYAPKWIEKIFYPLLGKDRYYRFEAWLCSHESLSMLYDKQLVLEDDRYCSAVNCCSPVDHEDNHYE